MFYYDTNERTGKRLGLAAAIAYVLLWVVLMLAVKFSFEPRESGDGIMINFGDTEQAGGLEDLPNNEQIADAAQPTSTASEVREEETLTQDFEDAPAVQEQPEKKPAETSSTQKTTPTQTPPQEKPREVNKRALFPGRTTGSSSTSEGATTGVGNQGNLAGTPDGSHEGTGTGTSGQGFDLSGRRPVGALPDPVYGPNKSGRVVIAIVVDAAGVVKSASYRAQGSTTNDSELINAAMRAAYKSRFNAIDGDGVQAGTITYNFRLK